MSAIAETGRTRNGSIIALVSAAHYCSHLMQLALPPLFFYFHTRFDASYTELGLVVTMFFVASGFGQAAAGVLVDRFGAQRLLIAGLIALSLGTALAGLVTAYWMLLPLALVAGLGNSVFHPADLSILSHRVSENRLGRAFAVHGVSGMLGYASAPVAVTTIAALANWRVALLCLGLLGLVVAAFLYANRHLIAYEPHAHVRHATARAGIGSYLSVVGSPVIVMAFAYFMLTAFAGTGIQTFSITAFTSGYGLPLELASFGLTAYLFGGVAGILLGGFLAERTSHHQRVAMSGMVVASALMLLVAGVLTDPATIVATMAAAGFASGITAPSRDVLVRRAAAGAGMGSVFGFVYSGFDLGSSTAPLLFGALLDHHAAHGLFLVLAVAFALAAPTVMQFSRPIVRPAPIPAEAD
jgi:FSR family fosmidomycin resistance protein-like MFS transporter